MKTAIFILLMIDDVDVVVVVECSRLIYEEALQVYIGLYERQVHVRLSLKRLAFNTIFKIIHQRKLCHILKTYLISSFVPSLNHQCFIYNYSTHSNIIATSQSLCDDIVSVQFYVRTFVLRHPGQYPCLFEEIHSDPILLSSCSLLLFRNNYSKSFVKRNHT